MIAKHLLSVKATEQIAKWAPQLSDDLPKFGPSCRRDFSREGIPGITEAIGVLDATRWLIRWVYVDTLQLAYAHEGFPEVPDEEWHTLVQLEAYSHAERRSGGEEPISVALGVLFLRITRYDNNLPLPNNSLHSGRRWRGF